LRRCSAEGGGDATNFARAADVVPTRGHPSYRFTMNGLPLLDPPAVTTFTLIRPNLAFFGTLHLMRVAPHEVNFVTLVAPNVT
jgi:hypothetical protein